MKIKNLQIATQLKLSLAAMFLLVLVLGVVSYIQTGKIHTQTELLYDHPLQVRRAIGELKADILLIQRNMKDIFLDSDQKEIANNLNQIVSAEANAYEQINILYEKYLGPPSQIDSVKQYLLIWNNMREETLLLLRGNKIDEAKNRTASNGIVSRQVEALLTAIQKIDNFAIDKGDSLYEDSGKLANSLSRQLIILIIIILSLSIIINFILLRNIRKPIKELTDVANRFQKGDMNIRSLYQLKNEFGVLSDSFNALVAFIQLNTDLDKKFVDLAGIMMSEYDANKFFKKTLHALAKHTNAQMSAVYLLSNDRKSFEHFESVGIEESARQSFSASNFEGEFGAVLSTHKLQHIKNIPSETRFVFNTVNGKFIPHEILGIPVISGNKVIAIISLASLNVFTNQSVQLIDDISDTMNARIEGILAYRLIKEFSKKMEFQNRELETQKTELQSQSAELIEQNTELEMQKKQLNEVSRLKTNFLSNMSHELRTPLNSVIALSGVLNRRLVKKISEEEYSYIEVIERNAKHLLDLINDILDISRIEAGREEIEITKFNANSLIDEVVSMIHPQAEQKKIELRHLNNAADLFLSSDAGKCRHILQNIIANAVKFTEKGKVEVSACEKGNNIIITVIDTGIGISEDHISQIFDEFRQADGSTSRKFGGTGLGLAIAKKYANLLGGSILVSSIPGNGSEFTISLPLHYAAENRIIAAEDNSINSPLPQISNASVHLKPKTISNQLSKTILLVEDSEPAIIQIKDFLEESGYQIMIAANGIEAFERISDVIPDAIILDLMMPGIDGFEVLKTLREKDATMLVPVLILTAKHITKEELSFLKRNNIHELIQKGDVKREELLKAVKSMLSPKTEENQYSQSTIQKITGKPTVLVVEDNPDNMITVKALLTDNYIVIEAVDGNKAIEMAKLKTPDFILMDIALPQMDGIEAFNAIRSDARLKNIPVIALTASAMTSDRETILAHGFDAYIAKPIDEKLFFNTINKVLYGE